MKTTLAQHIASLRNFYHKLVGEISPLAFHKKELVACLLLALLYAKLDKVQQFFSSFATALKGARDLNSGDVFLHMASFIFNGFVVFWLSYVFWHKPKNLRGPIVRFICGDRKDRSYTTYFKKKLNIWWLAVVASLPVFLSSLTMALAMADDSPLVAGVKSNSLIDPFLKNRGTTYLVASLLYFLISAYLFRPKDLHGEDNSTYKVELRKGMTYILVFLAVVVASGFIFTIYWKLKIEENSNIEAFLLLLFSFAPAMLLSHFWYHTSRLLLSCTTNESGETDKQKETFGKADKLNEWFRLFSYGLSASFFVLTLFDAVTVQRWFSRTFFPLAVLLFVFIFYYQIWDLLKHNVTLTRRRWVLAIGLVLLFFKTQTEHYQLFKGNAADTAGSINHDDRFSMELYFLAWAKKHFDARDKAMPVESLKTDVYLVAAEGGGSRSGAWTSAVLTELDKKSEGKFRRNCFAISTVSGGTVGTAATLALWDSAYKEGKLDSMYAKTTVDTIDKRMDYLNEVFGRNYLTSSIMGLFFHDFFQSIPGIHLLYTSDCSRTDRHQAEENDAIRCGLNGVFGDNPGHNAYFQGSKFLDLFYRRETTGVVLPDNPLPLFFPNTARVEDGRRGILSPIANLVSDSSNSPLFVSGLDVIEMAGQKHQGKRIGLAAAVGLSQLFPYINSNVQIDTSTGTYMDGGAFENMGITTIMEVHRALQKVKGSPSSSTLSKLITPSDTDSFMKFLSGVKLHLVIVYNSPIRSASFLNKEKFTLQALDPLSTVLKTPFTGHTEATYWEAKHELKDSPDSIFEYKLLLSDTQDVVMSRWLSNPELNYIFKRAQDVVR